MPGDRYRVRVSDDGSVVALWRPAILIQAMGPEHLLESPCPLDDTALASRAAFGSRVPSALNGIAVRGESVGGVGVMGLSDNDIGVYGGGQTGVNAVGEATGLRGSSEDGRGGVLEGGKAQLRLLPSSRNSHPASGAAGDLFLDMRKRLWLCKGGASWARLD